ncbi:succinyl-diaminopimelate desuccinylase [Agrilactobacillus composti DSM 18527 = JCM 14202]|uniref:Probable succinyl-diaminopimelate desuccinylase n=1 Tax=Agrilactobacillus composti DSM 18527 = JCM 14202 TaxID=1423734 RepID=A0A0R1XKM8_9LACO|nr:ArgE/DapE family deacylase [Agrilactobacillus composti]KRM30775.1 succinyl-diaminopimelate desuccinylase [Agrilactobacillus composti DSM 18527 = JCM 14202]
MTQLNEAARLKILSDLVAIPSVNGSEQLVAEYLENLLAQYGIESEVVQFSEKRANLVAEIGSGRPVLGISGHLDVVSPGDAKAWLSGDPFTLTEKDGRLYGRGSEDMKSGLAAMAIALIEIKAAKTLKQGTLRFLATVGEEVGEPGAEQLQAQGYFEDVDALIIGEPTGYNIVYAHKGPVNITLTSHGEAAHSSTPEAGYNALNPLFVVLNQANTFFDNLQVENETLGKVIFNPTVFHGGDQVNTIPGLATAEVNVRTIPEFDNHAVVQALQTIIDQENAKGADITLDVTMNLAPVAGAKDSRLVDLATTIGQDYSTQQIDATAKSYGTDASKFLIDKADGFPVIIFGPGNDTAHKVNEYVDKQMYFDFVDLYQRLFSTYLNEAKVPSVSKAKAKP